METRVNIKYYLLFESLNAIDQCSCSLHLFWQYFSIHPDVVKSACVTHESNRTIKEKSGIHWINRCEHLLNVWLLKVQPMTFESYIDHEMLSEICPWPSLLLLFGIGTNCPQKRLISAFILLAVAKIFTTFLVKYSYKMNYTANLLSKFAL